MKRSGFTLVELLVSISILVILAAITVAGLNYTAEKERVSDAARTVQTFIEGARNRAATHRKPVGVRLILNQNGPRNSAGQPITATSLEYVEAMTITGQISVRFDPADPQHLRRLEFWHPGPDGEPGIVGVDDAPMNGVADDTTGEFHLNNGDGCDDVFLTSVQQQFQRAEAEGWLRTGAQITLRKTGFSEVTYTLENLGPGAWGLTKDVEGGTITDAIGHNFELTLFPVRMANQTVRELPVGTVVDLETMRVSGRLPGAWYDAGTQRYSDTMDIMFSPRGIGHNDLTWNGILSLVFTAAENIETSVYSDANNEWFYEMDSRPEHERDRIVGVNLKTGFIFVSFFDFTDTSVPMNFPDDPFKYAETGVVAR